MDQLKKMKLERVIKSVVLSFLLICFSSNIYPRQLAIPIAEACKSSAKREIIL